ncbi:OmpA family protein [Candidatus Raskinella chloraquaticus]|uniref:OmpA family protein n=1 Tax=Candidatus Raskinella chloraquaticus TaxID=1951219 RepID=UPI00366E81C7
MQALLRVIVGLAIVTGVGGLAFVRDGDRLSADIAARSQKIVSAVDNGWAGMSIAGRDVRLSGNAPDVEARDRLVKTLDALPGVRRIDVATGILARQSPYEWKLGRQANDLSFSGSIPSEANRLAFSSLLSTYFPTLKVADTARLAAGAPDNLGAMQKFAEDVIANLAVGSVSASDKALKIEGVAASPAAFAGLQDVLTKLPAGVTLASVAISPPTVTPYVFSARKEGQTLTLGGLVPSFAARDSLLADMRNRFATVSVTQALQFASPTALDAAWADNRSALLTQLMRLRDGTLTISDGVVSLAGLAPGVFEREQILAALAKLPPGLSLGQAALTIPETPPVDNLFPPPADAAEPVFPVVPPPQIVAPPLPVPPPPVPPPQIVAPVPVPPPAEPAPVVVPLAWEAVRTPGQLVITGIATPALKQAAGRLFGSGTIVDETVTGGDIPASMVERIEKSLDFLARLEHGRLTLNESGISLSGHAPSPAIREEVMAGIAALSSDTLKIAATLTAPQPAPPPPPHRCQSDLDATIRSGVINFATGAADLSRSSEARLKAVADSLMRCAEARLEISGHTDHQGDPDDNRELSEARARAVVEWLIDAGIAPERLTAAGFGDTRPIASNDTAEGRAQNRRIEFRLY